MSPIHITPRSICELREQVTALRADVESRGQAIFEEREAFLKRDAYRESARNLAHYLALRSHDVRNLQLDLIHHGFASLGRIETDVLKSLTTIERALRSICDRSPYEPLPQASAFANFNRLRQEATTVLGPSPDNRSVRIMVTLPTEAADDPTFVANLIDHGADCVRINCAHDNEDVWAAMIAHTRQAAAERNRTCRVYMDIGGPKIRTEAIGFSKKHRLHVGDTLLLTRYTPTATDTYPYQVSCAAPEILKQVGIGESVWFDDGKIGTHVMGVVPEGLVLRVEKTGQKGARVRLQKGINFPDTRLEISPLTDKDLSDLDFIVRHADMVGYSFVQTGDDITRLQSEIEKRLQDPADMDRLAVIAKVETKLAVSNLPSIIVRGAGRQPFGVMIARGDLAVEIGFERLAEIQEEIVWICEAAHVPVIWATQVLEGMTKQGLPSRAEITDAASGIQAECVMLNKGDYITDSVATLNNILQRMTGHHYKRYNVLRVLHSWERYVHG